MPSLGTSVVVFDENRVLLTLRTDVPVWIVPGGGVEPCESVEQAAVRETCEETGLEVKVVRVVGVYSRPFWRSGGDHEIVVEAHVVGGGIAINYEASRIEFFSLDNLPSDLVPWNRVYINDALRRQTGHEVFLRAFEMRWPFEDQDYPRKVVERLVRDGLTLAEAQHKFAEQTLANVGELPLGDA